jgi:predicted CoA-substrate-specific enzyme activase
VAYAAGVDVGSTQTKAVIVNEALQLVSRALVETGANVLSAAEHAFEQALRTGNLAEEEVAYIVGTGYGRYRVTFGHTQVTEISCHGRGAVHLFPNTRTVLDMGGQDTKAIRVTAHGEIVDFCMNDKCAAGTGRFLGAAASALEIPLDRLGPTALQGSKPVRISTTCTVFAESEVLSWLGKGRKIEDILLGVHHSIAARSIGLLRRVGIAEEVTFTGGVARNQAMVRVLNAGLGLRLNVSEESHYMGALGAALFAMQHLLGSRVPMASAEQGCHAAPTADTVAGGHV